MRRILISDIHGQYDMFMELLEKIKFKPHQDKLILLGDYINGGLQSKKVLDYLLELKNEYYHHVFLMGNHDFEILKKLFQHEGNKEKMKMSEKILNGWKSFLPESYLSLNFSEWVEYFKENYSHFINFLHELEIYYEEDEWIATHIGIHCSKKDWRNKHFVDNLKNQHHFLSEKNKTKKIIFFGHFAVQYLLNDNYFFLYFDNSRTKIGIDGGAGGECRDTKQLNAVILYPTESREPNFNLKPEELKDEYGIEYISYGRILSNFELKHYYVRK